MNQGASNDPEDRAEMSRIIRAFAIDLDRPINHDFREDDSRVNLTDGITESVGI